MKHNVRGRKLGRNQAHRDALGKNLVQALFKNGRIITTEAKAKEYRALAEKLITLAKKGDLASRRRVVSMLGCKDTTHKLFADIAPRFKERTGGYTRILHLMNETGKRRPKGESSIRFRSRRLGDNGRTVIFELVEKAVVAAPDSAKTAATTGKAKKKA